MSYLYTCCVFVPWDSSAEDMWLLKAHKGWQKKKKVFFCWELVCRGYSVQTHLLWVRRPLTFRPWEAGKAFWSITTTVHPERTQISKHTLLHSSEAGSHMCRTPGLPWHDCCHVLVPVAGSLHISLVPGHSLRDNTSPLLLLWGKTAGYVGNSEMSHEAGRWIGV